MTKTEREVRAELARIYHLAEDHMTSWVEGGTVYVNVADRWGYAHDTRTGEWATNQYTLGGLTWGQTLGAALHLNYKLYEELNR